ncbi:SDR family NAD(P)-dependent oxidoreductase [Pontiella sulfatireligans]|uniref:3-oxoacyl-[acyl-carrier-protein] reductase FabG n=1 Tax=Pontiella sulfatireligans TaxID=2750658 RepID=A0A6C2USS4_9BACT|nr:SDR family oxidoreductase [Pontiella sulfatireligans]VGO23382.1 3-oxoacyl-[acyl-carrier-protein] reductase FabG [Pontiella sulfatireligans]
MKLNIKSKTALVTGGSRGIGTAICRDLAEEGVNVGINYNSSAAEAEELAKELAEQFGVKAVALKGNLAEEQDIFDMIAQCEEAIGEIGILVNNAAYCPSGPLTSYTKEEWEFTFSVNVTGCFIISREMVKRWLEREVKGKIVNVASQAAFLGSTSGHLPYDSSKGAMVSMTRAIAREVAPKGINVNAVAPGLVKTEMVKKNLETKLDSYLARIPLYRIAEPEEIASIVTFLASDAAAYMTGTTLDATGGMMMR